MLSALLVLLSSIWTSAVFADGAKLYKRCAACHLASGEGVVGTFPPLKNRLSHLYETPEGRAYLVLVLSKGVTGPIEINGVQYRGFMPAQGRVLKNVGIADVLNYIRSTFHDVQGTGEDFTEEEITKILERAGKIDARSVGKMRTSLFSDGTGK